MEEALQGRRMVPVTHTTTYSDRESVNVSVSSYNILSAKKVQLRRAEYSHCVPHVLNFALRKQSILSELKAMDSDVCCLQSIDHFDDWWQPQLGLLGYDGVFSARSGGIAGEGVAIFFKRELFQLFKSKFIDFNEADEALLSAAEKTRRKKKATSIPNNVGVIVGLQPWEKSKHPSAILVANLELNDSSGGPGVLKRNNQCVHFCREVESFNAELHLPLIVCGTFNCVPGTMTQHSKVHVFQLLTTFVSRCLHCTGDATHHILTTGRIRYTKQLPDAPAAPVAATPSCSSMVVRWKPPVNAGDYPIIGYRLLRRAGGATKMRFGREIAVDEKTFKVCFAENLIILFPL